MKVPPLPPLLQFKTQPTFRHKSTEPTKPVYLIRDTMVTALARIILIMHFKLITFTGTEDNST